MARIAVDPGLLAETQTVFTNRSGEIDAELDTLRGLLEQLDWEGQDKVSYEQHKAAWDSAVRDINELLTQIGSAVGVAGENYVTTELNNSRLWTS